MDVREKLVELLSKYFDIGDSYCYNLTRTKNAFACGTMGFDDFEEFDDETVADIADHLIAHGVTVQEWISVKAERKPNHGDIALCYMTFGEYRLLQWDDRSKLWVGDYMDYGFEDAAYWQLPQPPKGE